MKTTLTLMATLSLMASMACDNGGNNTNPPADCTAGTFGCPCLPEGTCGDRDGEPLVCFNEICTTDNAMNPDPTPTPNPGVDPTPDATPNPNPDPMPMDGLGLAIDNADARACEVLLVDPERKIAEVIFADAVEGRSKRQGDRLAIAFSAKADEGLTPGAANFLLAQGIDDITGITAQSGRCFDRQGAVMAGVNVTPVDMR